MNDEEDSSFYDPEDCEECGFEGAEYDDSDWYNNCWNCPNCGGVQ